MNIHHLQYFIEVYRLGTVTKAASLLHVSQPSVTAAIYGLEKSIGIKLFSREKNRLKPTKEGEAFYQITSSFLKEYNNYLVEANELSEGYQGVINFGIPAIMGTFFLPKIMPRFEEEYPGVLLKGMEVPTITGLELLKNRDLDFILGLGDDNIQSYFYSKTIMETEIQLAVHRENPLAKKTYITEEDLEEERFVTVAEGSYHYAIIEKHFPRVIKNSILFSNQTETIRNIVVEGLASTIIYKDLFAEEEEIVCIPFKEALPVSINLLWKKEALMSKKMKKFVKFMTAQI